MGTILQYILPIWSAIGVYTIIGLMQVNGTYEDILSVEKTGVYPKSMVIARNDFTGIEQLDSLLRIANATFWPIIDGTFPAASLHCFQFAGAYGATWTVLLLESIRSGNQGKVVSFITIIGLITQLASYGVTISLYLALHLWTSPTVSGTKPDTALVHPLKAILMPWSMILGYILPVIMLILPSPFPVSFEQKQNWLALWNVFPLLVSLSHFVLTTLGTSIFSHSEYTAYTKKTSLSNIRAVYAFAFTVASVTHVASWTVSLSSLLFPALYSPDILPQLHPARVFLPVFSHEVTEWPLGMHRLLQWDNFIGSTALLAWAVVLWLKTNRVNGVKSSSMLLPKLIGLIARSGITGTAVVFLWERDALLLGEPAMGRKQSQ